MKSRWILTLVCVLGLTTALCAVCLASASAAESGRKIGPLTKLLIDKGTITRNELELEDATYEPQELPKGSAVHHEGGIVTSLLKKKGVITREELMDTIREAVQTGEIGTKGSPLVSLLVKKNVITEDEAAKVLKALGITPPEKPAPAPAPAEEKPAEEKPAEQPTAQPEAPAAEQKPAEQPAAAQPEAPASQPSAPAAQ